MNNIMINPKLVKNIRLYKWILKIRILLEEYIIAMITDIPGIGIV